MNVRQVVPRDAIPSVDDPMFDETYDGDADDLVVVVESSGRPRAYPIRYLHYHEVVNDVLGSDVRTSQSISPNAGDMVDTGDGERIAVTWCPLCGSAVVYDRFHEDHVLEFGASGKLADDDLVLYDRETGSEWKQSSGECIAGTFEGASLSVRPATLVSWREFHESYPDGVVLHPPGGESEAASDDETPAPVEYDRSPYDAYFAGDGFGLGAHRGTNDSREWERDDDLSPKTVVLGVEVGETALGFPLSRVREAGGVVQTRIDDRAVVVFATDEAGIHGFTDPGYSFISNGDEIVGDGTTWNPKTGRAADGRRLNRLSARRLFAFAWQDDHGPGAFYASD